MAAILSLLKNKHGQKKGIVPFTSVELMQVVLKKHYKAKQAKMRDEEAAAKSRNIQITILQWQ